MMKIKFLTATACFCFLTTTVPALAAGIDGTALGSCTTLTYSTNPQYPPYDWAVRDEYFEGASIELLRMVVPPSVALKPVVYPWKRSMLLAEKGKIDLLVSLRITPERSEYLKFTSHRAFSNPIAVFVREDRQFPYTSWQDLKPHQGGVALGDTFGGGFDEYWKQELQVETAPTMVDNFRKLEAGNIDYFVSGYYLGQAYLARHKPVHPIVALSPPVSDMDIHFGFSRRSNCIALLDYVSSRLEELDKQGVPARLLDEALIQYGKNPDEPIPK